jgi:Transposase DNA-binding/Transposase DDE domain
MIGNLVREFEGARFGDGRLSARLLKIVEAALQRPAVGFPRMIGNESDLEGTYRFVRNEKVTHERILAPHRERTVERCRAQEEVLVVHDSSNFTFKGEVADLGIIGTQKGFMGHFSLAVMPGEGREVLGVLAHQIIVRKTSRKAGGRRPGAEHDRWAEQAIEVGERIGESVVQIHVMDREADDYELFHQLMAARQNFVVRNFRPRKLAESGEILRDWLPKLEVFLERDVRLSKRLKSINEVATRVHPPREVRSARLAIRAGLAIISRPSHRKTSKELPATMRLGVVWVTEIDCPDGETPVDWCLLTTLSVETAEQVAKVVDSYRSRWVVEDFFKALKSGCGFERRQLESLHTLLNTLAVLMPIACTLLQLRGLSRDQPDRPASAVLTETQITVLRVLAKKSRPLPKEPTVHDAAYSIAALGGHLMRNGPPGWQTLALGLEDLFAAEQIWLEAKSS